MIDEISFRLVFSERKRENAAKIARRRNFSGQTAFNGTISNFSPFCIYRDA